MITEYCDILEKYLKRKVRFGFTNRYVLNIMIEIKEKKKVISFMIDMHHIKCVYLNFNFEILLKVIKNDMIKGYYTIIEGELI